MLRLRRAWTILVGAWVAAWLARALFDWILGLGDTPVLVLTLVAAALGALACIDEARSIEPWTVWDERDAYLGWITFLGLVAVMVCFFIPMPWGGMAAAVVAAVTIVVLRRSPRVPMEERRPERPA